MAVQRYMIDFSALYAKLQKYFLIARNVSSKAKNPPCLEMLSYNIRQLAWSDPKSVKNVNYARLRYIRMSRWSL